MSESEESDATTVLSAIRAGDPKAAEQLLPLVYNELRRLAACRMKQESPDHTLDATALVHEAYLRLVGGSPTDWQGRAHFFAAAATAMRRILIEQARSKGRIKRGGKQRKLDLRKLDLAVDASSDELQALDEALEKLAVEDPVKAELVSLRFFAGLTLEESAQLLQISRATASRYWTYARAKLYQELSSDPENE